jgi:hypothetical protein
VQCGIGLTLNVAGLLQLPISPHQFAGLGGENSLWLLLRKTAYWCLSIAGQLCSIVLMRTLRLFLLLIASSASVDGKWAPLPKEELIRNADAIVIADYTGYQSVTPQGMYDQLGSFRLVRSLKGNVDPSFFVYGSSKAICAPLIFFKSFKSGRYLLFLSKREFGWTDCNAAMIPIQDDKLNWFRSDDQSDRGRSEQFLLAVIADIENHLASDRR